MSSNVFTAPRCRILIDGKRIARGQNVSYTAEIEYVDVDVLDNIETEEFAPVSYKVNGTISKVIVRGESAKSLGLIPATGKDADEHLENILLHGDNSMALMDKASPPKTLATLYKVKFTSYGITIAARGIALTNVNFKAIREMDESEL